MKLLFKTESQLEKFGIRVYNLLVENFPETYFVGGVVRDLLLKKNIFDIDLATIAEPKEIIKVIQSSGIKYDDNNSKFGVVSAIEGSAIIEIATLREDIYRNGRYPKVRFISSVKVDSTRRDFTINSLYFKPETGNIVDFQSGIKDLNSRSIRFIGDAKLRILEDPLRILRAFRFCLDLEFSLEKKTRSMIQKYFSEINKITISRKNYELKKINSEKNKKIIEHVLKNPQELDKYF